MVNSTLLASLLCSSQEVAHFQRVKTARFPKKKVVSKNFKTTLYSVENSLLFNLWSQNHIHLLTL